MIDHQILRLITGAHQKAPVEMLYLEKAELLIKKCNYCKETSLPPDYFEKTQERANKENILSHEGAPIKR